MQIEIPGSYVFQSRLIEASVEPEHADRSLRMALRHHSQGLNFYGGLALPTFIGEVANDMLAIPELESFVASDPTIAGPDHANLARRPRG
jgi:hypothetical protein